MANFATAKYRFCYSNRHPWRSCYPSSFGSSWNIAY